MNPGQAPAVTIGPTLSQAPIWNAVSVKQTGAVGDGITDDTAAIVKATQSFSTVLFPPGNYLIQPTTFTNLTNCNWIGVESGGVGITTKTPGNMLTFGAGCGFNVVSGIIFQPTVWTLPSSVGVVLTNGCGTTTFSQCVFQLWSKAGMMHTGVVGNQMSGHKVYDCYFLQNANGSGFGQLDMTYSNDFFVQNNQMGIINTAVYGFPSYGLQSVNSSNGGYMNNFVWQNNIGANFTTCKYERLLSNRFEQSQKEGAILTSCIETIFSNNWFNNNGIATLNTYNHLRWIGCSRSTCIDNIFFDWSGAVNSQKYAVSLESTCSTMSLKTNVASAYATGAWQIDSGTAAQSLNTDGAITFNSGGTITAGTTTFLTTNGVNVTGAYASQYIPVSHTVIRLMVAVTAAPGVGQTFAYTLYKDGVATGTTITLSGSGGFQGFAQAAAVYENSGNSSFYTVQVVTSAGATAAGHFATIQYCER